MTTMETIQIRLPKQDLQSIDRDVRHGLYQSRSDAFRRMYAQTELIKIFSEFEKIFKQSGVSKKELLAGLKEARTRLYKKYR